MRGILITILITIITNLIISFSDSPFCRFVLLAEQFPRFEVYPQLRHSTFRLIFQNAECWMLGVLQAPVTEEVAFRGCTAAVLHLCWTTSTVIFVSPVFFSLAHLHHLVDHRKRGLTLQQALLTSCNPLLRLPPSFLLLILPSFLLLLLPYSPLLYSLPCL